MNVKHLGALAETLAVLKPLHTRLDAVGDELQRAYSDQSGEWRQGDAAREELGTIEEAVGGLETAKDELIKLIFPFSEVPDFATIIGQGRLPPGVEIAPLPDKFPTKAESMAEPRRPGAPPYPFLKRPEETNDD
jgi:hypothetical protein